MPKTEPRYGAADLETVLRQRAAAARANIALIQKEPEVEERTKAELDRAFKDAVRKRDEIQKWVTARSRELEEAQTAYDAKVRKRPGPMLRPFIGKKFDAELADLYDEVEQLRERLNIGQAQLGDAQKDVLGARQDRAAFKPKPPEDRAAEIRNLERHAKAALIAVDRIPQMQVGEGLTLRQALEWSARIGRQAAE